MEVIKHVLGAYDPATLKQYCLLCGKAIVDYEGTAWAGEFAPGGWAEGDFFEAGKNPTVMMSELPDDYLEPGDQVIDCTKI